MKLPQLSKIQTISGKIGGEGKVRDPGRWRDLLAYWILGLCNNFGYVVMLSAAHDIIARINKTEAGDGSKSEHDQICHVMSTGMILLADIIPSLTIKGLSPFLPNYINIRIFLACFTQCAGFLMVAFAQEEWMALTGVGLTSFSSGLGETSFLGYSAKFHRNVISTWSSGTGGAGIFGSFLYAGLIEIGLSPVNTMLLMLSVPMLEGAAFWILLRNPNSIPKSDSEPQFQQSPNDQESATGCKETKKSLSDKIRYVPSLLKYVIPLLAVYLFEYFINQGLMELVYFKDIWLDHKQQYRWFQVDYQVGVFISRSSVNLITINQIWLMGVLQLVNVGFFLAEVMTYFTPSIFIIFGMILWEGLLGGAAYVNTFYRLSKEVPDEWRNFAMGIVTMSDSIGITLAGAIAIPVHNAICANPLPIRS